MLPLPSCLLCPWAKWTVMKSKDLLHQSPPPNRPPPSSQVGSRAHPKVSLQKDLLDDICSLEEPIRVYSASKDTVKETGIPLPLQVHQEQCTTGKGASLYICKHECCQSPLFFAQSPAGLYSHVHRKHLGMALSCPYCQRKLFWNSKGWLQHMDKQHTDVPHYGHQVVEEAQMAAQLLEQVKADPNVLTKEATEEERLS